MKIRPRPVVNNGKRVWCLDLRALGKGRKYYDSKSDAGLNAQGWQTEYENHGARAFDLTAEERTQFLAAKARLAGVGATIDSAVDFFMKHGPVREKKTVADAVKLLLADRRANGKRERYITQLRSTLSQFAKGREQALCSEVTRQDVSTWLHGNGWGAKTKLGKLIDVRTMFSFALENGWCSIIPCPKRDSITLDDKPPGILTVHQCRKLLEAAQKHEPTLVPYIAIGLFCGLRPESELEILDWDSVDLDRKIIEVKARKSKSRARRIVDLSDNCVAWLRLKGQLPPVNLKRKFERVREHAGITDWPDDGLRHSFASYHYAKHGSADKTAAQMGHRSTATLFSHYRELVKPADADAFWEIVPAA